MSQPRTAVNSVIIIINVLMKIKNEFNLQFELLVKNGQQTSQKKKQ